MPRKLGQHFLADRSILEQLAVAACPQRCVRVIEIGPGKGALTRYLLPRTDELHAVEVDEPMLEQLRREWASEPKFHLHHADVLLTDLSQWGEAVIAGNLPYYITSPIIDKFLHMDGRFPIAVFLMQREVAERILAKPGTRDYGYLTVSCQLVCETELICRVPPGAFRPAPKVESAAVRFRRRVVRQTGFESVLQLASRAFAQKRKTLRNNLRAFYSGAIERQPEAGLRAEQLSPRQFVDLYQRLTQHGHTVE